MPRHLHTTILLLSSSVLALSFACSSGGGGGGGGGGGIFGDSIGPDYSSDVVDPPPPPTEGGGSGGAGGGAGAASPRDFLQSTVTTMCDLIHNCEEISSQLDDDAKQFLGNDESECNATLGPFVVELGSASFDDGINKGRLNYNAQKAGQCLSLFEQIGCDFEAASMNFTEADAIPCMEAFEPQQEVGDECLSDGECKDGGKCPDGTLTFEEGSMEPGFQYGVCTPPKQIGDDCNSSDECAEGLECMFEDDGQICVGFIEDGMACVPGSGGGGGCNPESSCNPDGAGGFACGAIPSEGEPCSGPCQGDTYCQFSDESGVGVCSTFAQVGDDCTTALCASELTCVFEDDSAVCKEDGPEPIIECNSDFPCEGSFQICHDGACTDATTLPGCDGGECPSGEECLIELEVCYIPTP